MNNLKMLFAASVAEGNGVSFPDVRAPIVDTRDIGDCAAALCLADDARYHGKFIEVRVMPPPPSPKMPPPRRHAATPATPSTHRPTTPPPT